MFKKLIDSIRTFIARLFIRQALKNSVVCACCKQAATKIMADTPYVVAVCNAHVAMAKGEITRMQIKQRIAG